MQPQRHFSLVFATLAILFLVAVSSAGAAQWYVSTTGTSTNAGTLASPWSLEYALADYSLPVAPGDTIWILPGDYYTADPAMNMFGVSRRGDSSGQVTIRNYQNGRVTVHGRIDCGFQSSGSYPARNVTFWGLEITNRDIDPTGYNQGFVSGYSTIDPGVHTGLKLVNCVLHDCGASGISTARSVDDFQAVGNLIYFNGREVNSYGAGIDGITARCEAPLGAGHGQLFKDNLVLSNFGNGATVLSPTQEHIVFDGDVFMKSGEPSFVGMSKDISFEDVTGNALQPVLNNIYTFMPSTGWQGGLVTIDNTTNAQINGGYFYSTLSPFSLGATNTGLVMNNNTIVGTIGGFTINQYGTGNTLLATAPASGKKIVVRPNDFETGRANIIIYNWDQSSTVSVDISASGMVSGWQYEVLDAQNFYAGPVATGTYTGAAISIPMTGLTAATPVDPYSMVPQHTAPEFGLFILRPVNNAPVVTMGAAPAVQLPATTATLSATVTDDALPAGHAVTVAWTQVSGPGTATLANASALSTLATFSAAGTYVFRITATDSAVSSIGEVSVQVLPIPSGGGLVMHLPLDEASGITAADTSGYGRDGTLYIGTAVGSTLPEWITGRVNGGILFKNKGETVRVPSFPLSNEFSVAFWFKPAPSSLDANHGGYHYIFSWGSVGAKNSINVWFTTASETGMEKAMRLCVLDNDDPTTPDPTISFNDANYPFDDGAWHHFTATIAASGTQTVYLDGNQVLQATVGGGGAITPPTNLFMGMRSDLNSNRCFDGGIDDVRVYSKVLTPAEANALAHPVVTNVAPVANAGPDKYVMMPYALALGGAVSDDGLPTPPATCTASWTKVSGPGVVTFTNASAAATNATFSAAGTYVLRLTASDSALVNSDDKQVIVLRAGDFTGDGRVDGLDFLRWQSNYPNFIGGATPDGGDGNNDGKVDGLDFLVWQSNYGG